MRRDHLQQRRLAFEQESPWQSLPEEIRDRVRELLVRLVRQVVAAERPGQGGEDE